MKGTQRSMFATITNLSAELVCLRAISQPQQDAKQSLTIEPTLQKTTVLNTAQLVPAAPPTTNCQPLLTGKFSSCFP